MAIVYVHKKSDTGEVFYVGIGTYRERAFRKAGRGQHWQRTVKKHGYKIEITHEGVCWEEACSIEKYLIYFYGRADLKTGGLVNRTDGGDGVFNLPYEIRHNPEMKNRRAEALRLKRDNDPVYTKGQSDRMKKRWDSQEFRDMRVGLTKEMWSDDEFVEMQRRKGREMWENEDFRKMKMAQHAQQLKDPEFRKKINNGIKKGANSPMAIKLIVLETREVIGSFNDAEILLGKTRKTIRSWARMRHVVMYYTEYLKLSSNE